MFTIISFFIGFASVLDASAKPQTKTVTLQRVTHLTVEILPDMGSHFIFPFVLDETDSEIPFTNVSTNKIFKVDRTPKRNSFVVLINQDRVPEEYRGRKLPEYRGNLFLVVGDYNITIEMKITNEIDNHFTEYVFELGAIEEELLIQKMVQNRVALLEKDYEKRLAHIDELAEDKVITKLGELAATKPRIKNIKEMKEMSTDDGPIVLKVDRALHYGRFISFAYQIENQTNKALSVTGIEILQHNGLEDPKLRVHSVKDLPPRLMADQSFDGVVSINGTNLNPEAYVTLRLTTNKGEIDATW